MGALVAVFLDRLLIGRSGTADEVVGVTAFLPSDARPRRRDPTKVVAVTANNWLELEHR